MANQQSIPPTENEEQRLTVIRELVIEAGLEILDRDGLGLRADSITYARVFEFLNEEFDTRLTRSAVHGRIWDSQDEFRTEVLSVAADHTWPHEYSVMMHDAVVTILSGLDELKLTPRERVWAFASVAGESVLQGYLGSAKFRRFQAIKAAARSGDTPEATEILQTLVAEKADGEREDRIQRFGFVFDMLGLRPRADLGLDRVEAIDAFNTLIQILITGAHLDHHAGFEVMADRVETGTGQSADRACSWSYMGVAFLACIEGLFEEDPDAVLPPPNGYPTAEEIAPLVPAPEPLPELASLISDRPRRSRAELKKLVVAAGVHLFLRDGLRLKSESLTYASVFAHIEQSRGIVLHRSTVHQKIWSSQDEFRAEVLAASARYGTGESLTAMRQAMAAQTVTRNPDRSINVRQLILDNSLASVSAQMAVASHSATYNRWQSIKATMLSQPPGPIADVLRSAINSGYEDMLSAFTSVYRSVLPLVGLEVNPALGLDEDQAYHLFAVICATLSTGSDYNIAAGAEASGQSVLLPRADDSGLSQHWPIPALGSLAALDLIFVPSTAPRG